MSYQKLSAAICLTLAAPMVFASGFALIEQSASGQGLSYAGAAANAEDASVMWFNPAGLSEIKGSQFIVGMHAISPSAAFTNNGSSTQVPSTADGGNDNGATFGVVPNLYWKGHFAGHDLGLGINVPFGQHISYDPSWVGRYHATETNLKTVNINTAISKAVSDQLTFGFGLNAQYVDLEMQNKIDNRLVGDFITGDGSGNGKLTANCWAYGYNLGFLFKPTDATDLGVSYRSAMTHNAKGKVEYTNVNAALAGALGLANANASSTVNMPAMASFSLKQAIDGKLALLADATWTKWSDYKELVIDYDSTQADSNTRQDFKDSWRLSVGGLYQLSEAMKLRAGVAFDQTPITNPINRSPRNPDADRKWISVGMGYKLNSAVNIDVAYSHLFADKAEVNNYTTNDSQYLKGSYELGVDILSAQFVWNY